MVLDSGMYIRPPMPWVRNYRDVDRAIASILLRLGAMAPGGPHSALVAEMDNSVFSVLAYRLNSCARDNLFLIL